MSSHDNTRAGGRLGMWLFVATEIIFFGGLFLLYAMYRFKHPDDFHAASMELSRFLGTLNTAILFTSSLTVALSALALRANNPRRTKALLLASLGLAVAFLVVKAVEWSAKFEHGIYPSAATLLAKPKGEILYFGLYYSMTGLHAVHVIVGIGLLLLALAWVSRGRTSAERPLFLENTGLYWNLVELIWIFLFPLFYLVT